MIRTPRRSSRWWELDELVTLVDAVSMTGLDEPGIDALVQEGTVADVNIGGIRYFRRADLLAVGTERRKPKPGVD